MRGAIAALACLTPLAAPAQDLPGKALSGKALAGLEATVRACFAGYDPQAGGPSCLGRAAQGCTAAAGGGTAAVLACIGAETAVWDDLLNTEYKARRSEMLAQGGGLPDLLLDAQRAWIGWRDAECALETAGRADGALAGVAGANCLMEMTAVRAAQMRDRKVVE